MPELRGKVEYQVHIQRKDDENFGVTSEVHVFQHPAHAVFFLSQLPPVAVVEGEEPKEMRSLMRVIRYAPVRKPKAR